jgi:hypothetical protein
MTDTTGSTKQPDSAAVHAAQLLLRLTAERGEMPEPWTFDLASKQHLHRMTREDAELIVRFLQREQQPVPAWLTMIAEQPPLRPMRPARTTSRLSIAGLAIAIVFSALYVFILGASLLGAPLAANGVFDLTGMLAIFGVISIFFLLPLILAIVLGHIGAAIEKRTRPRASNASGVALILGYVFGSVALLSIAYEVVALIILIVGLTTQQGVS